eukprot:TRINITY_DN13141_c0_g1_i1.p1 TRINITY_DN13141_c0_g1~~TRINITY_DN13141_c0_g1_i1.p1  ORF type:complete len:115 (+),score=7.42 TRINITY_DN13141_c0_g1_i1:56-400(+)
MSYYHPQYQSQGAVRPLAKENILGLVHNHEDTLIRPQVEKACQRVTEKILEGASYGQRHFQMIVCKRDQKEGEDSWHRRQVLLWDMLTELGLEDFELRTEYIELRQAIILTVSY